MTQWQASGWRWRATAGQAKDQVEHLEGVDHSEHQRHIDNRSQQGPRDVTKPAPASRPVKVGGVI